MAIVKVGDIAPPDNRVALRKEVLESEAHDMGGPESICPSTFCGSRPSKSWGSGIFGAMAVP